MIMVKTLNTVASLLSAQSFSILFAGDYKPVQCDPAKGTCWCVNEITGEEIQGTLVHSSDNKTASCGRETDIFLSLQLL